MTGSRTLEIRNEPLSNCAWSAHSRCRSIVSLKNFLLMVREILGAIETRRNNLIVVPEDADFLDLGFSGFASSTIDYLRSKVEESGADSIMSRDALALLVRLAGRK